MDLKKELRIIVKYMLPKEAHDKDVIENYVDTLVLINEEYVKQLMLGGVVSSSEQLVCDVCGSNDVIEAPHMGRNCNRCHPL